MSRILIFGCLLFSFSFCSERKEKAPADTSEKKADSLLSLMTLEEKIGQMAQMNITTIMSDSLLQYYDSVTVFDLDTNKLIHLIKNFHIGSFLNGRGLSKETWFNYMDQLQRINMRYSRLKIPLLYGVDHVHGSSYLKEGTIFPHNINIAATFDTSFAGEMGRVTVFETAGLGHNWIFAPVMDLGRNKFWGRYYETFGEDPLLASRMGEAYIRGIQYWNGIQPYRVAACAKHFIGYSDPKSGWDRSPAEIPDQILREFFVPPFKAAIDAGVKTIMINSGEVNGIPVHASHEILTKLLREELGFSGVAVTDWMDIIALEKMHFVTDSEKEATYLAITAGIDMSMIPLTTDFCRYVKELVEEKRIAEDRINLSVKRILKLKFDLGLFENPFPDKSRSENIGKPESAEKALNAARESIVLLKNENNLLPLEKVKKIVVTGPVAKSKVALCGGWTYGFAAKSEWGFPGEMDNLYDALKKEFAEADVVFAEPDKIRSHSANADLIILSLGEKEAYAETVGSINDLSLSKDQMEVAEKVFQTGKPVALVLIEGRPRIIGEIFDKSQAVIFAGLPGIYGAKAIAEVISGKVNPSGKMSFTYPYKQGHIIPYNHKKSEYSSLRPVGGELLRYAMAEFGEGISYSGFTYSDLTLSDSVIHMKDTLVARIKVTNTGKRESKETCLWFVTDAFASVTRPVKELQHFEKALLKPGESREFVFRIIPSQHLFFPDKNGKILLEPGRFILSVGALKATFNLK
jgi:beta-glucosidase